MNTIQDDIVVIIILTDTDKICSLYKDIKDFDFFRALIENKYSNGHAFVFENPVPTIIIRSTLYDDMKLTSSVFSIVNAYRLTQTFHNITKENIEQVLNFMSQIGEKFDVQTLNDEIKLYLVNETNNVSAIENIMKSVDFVNKNYISLNIIKVTDIFTENKFSMDSFKHIFVDKKHNVNVLCTQNLTQLQKTDDFKSYIVSIKAFSDTYKSKEGTIQFFNNTLHISYMRSSLSNNLLEYGYLFNMYIKYEKKVEYCDIYVLKDNEIVRYETITNPLNKLNDYIQIEKIFSLHSHDCTHMYFYIKYAKEEQ